jgi:hypothetical protein
MGRVSTAGSSNNPLDEYILVLKEEGIMPLAWPPERVHLYTVYFDHSWSVRVCIRVA